jgi:hypothetical protein
MTDANEQSIPSRGSRWSEAVERVARDMIAILRDGACDDDEKDAAAETLLEAICPSPTLTDEEREAVELAYSRLTADTHYASVAATLRGLLERLGGAK